MKRYFPVAMITAVTMLLAASFAPAADLIEKARLDAAAGQLVDGGWVYGLSVGLINERGTQTAGYGHISQTNSAAPNENTLFEIGSITKVFTSLLLAQMVEEKQVTLDEPVQKLLGDLVTMPKGADREITLVDLATHSSGLPRMPSNFAPKDAGNPYADYTVEQLGQALEKLKLTSQPGAISSYSNLGVGILGQALSRRAGMPYEELVRKTICTPLEMADTVITLDASQKDRLAQGHDAEGKPISNWDLPTFAGAGALRSTTNDMLRFLSAEIGLTKTPLATAIAETQEIHFKNPAGDRGDVGLGWMIRRNDGIVWHNGQTGGYHSYAGFSKEKKVGVVLLASTSDNHVDRLGVHLLKLLMDGMAKPFKVPVAVPVKAAAIEPLVGEYQLAPQVTITVTRKGDQLFIQLTGQETYPVYAESDTRFFWRVVEAAVTFEKSADGKVEKLVLHQNGLDMSAPRNP